MILGNYFDKIYCINLDERTDRWEEVQKEFDKLGIRNNVVRVSAIKNENPRIGCRDTHLKIIKEAKENNYNSILIFEDDVLILDESILYLEESLNQLSYFNWSLFYLGATVDPSVGNLMELNKHILKTNFAYTTHAYAVNKNCYDLILNNATNYGIIDVFYCHVVIQKLLGLVINPMLAIQRSSYSDIEKCDVNYYGMIDLFNETKHKSGIDN